MWKIGFTREIYSVWIEVRIERFNSFRSSYFLQV